MLAIPVETVTSIVDKYGLSSNVIPLTPEQKKEENSKVSKKKKNNKWGAPSKKTNSGFGSNYNISWLNKHANTQISTAFVPCVHSGPCSEENCICVQVSFG